MGEINDPGLMNLGALTVRPFEIVPPGYIIWLKGTTVIGIRNPNADSEREKFLNKFGLTRDMPKGTTGIGISPEDYAALKATTP